MPFHFNIFKQYQLIQTFFSRKENGSMKLTSDPALMEKIFRNRKRFFLENNIDPGKVVSAEIVHKNLIKTVDAKDGGKVISRADGLITMDKDIYISITSADCLPIFLFEPEKEIIGMVHAGWRSLADNILVNANERIKSMGGQPKNILAGIGPAICEKHYEVGPDVAEKFAKYPKAIKIVDNKTFLDIKNIAELQLMELGLEEKNIEISPECTFELQDKYFSARRDSSLTNCLANNDIKYQKVRECRSQQLVRDKKEIEATIAVIGMKVP